MTAQAALLHDAVTVCCTIGHKGRLARQLCAIRHWLSRFCVLDQIDLHGLHVDEALRVLESHLLALGGLNHPGGTLIQVCCLYCCLYCC